MYQMGVFEFSAGTFWQFWAKMYQMRFFEFSASTFWPFWAKMYRLGVFYSQPVHVGHSEQKCTGWGFSIVRWYILAISDENVPGGGFSDFGRKCSGWGFYILSRYILAISDENVPGGGFLFAAGTCWPFWAKLYRLGVLYSQPVHFGHFGRKCARWESFILSPYILAVLGENVLAGGCLFSAGTLWPFWPKMYQLGIFCSQPAHYRHFRQ